MNALDPLGSLVVAFENVVGSSLADNSSVQRIRLSGFDLALPWLLTLDLPFELGVAGGSVLDLLIRASGTFIPELRVQLNSIAASTVALQVHDGVSSENATPGTGELEGNEVTLEWDGASLVMTAYNYQVDALAPVLAGPTLPAELLLEIAVPGTVAASGTFALRSVSLQQPPA